METELARLNTLVRDAQIIIQLLLLLDKTNDDASDAGKRAAGERWLLAAKQGEHMKAIRPAESVEDVLAAWDSPTHNLLFKSDTTPMTNVMELTQRDTGGFKIRLEHPLHQSGASVLFVTHRDLVIEYPLTQEIMDRIKRERREGE